jgi:hypothetical protein
MGWTIWDSILCRVKIFFTDVISLGEGENSVYWWKIGRVPEPVWKL